MSAAQQIPKKIPLFCIKISIVVGANQLLYIYINSTVKHVVVGDMMLLKKTMEW